MYNTDIRSLFSENKVSILHQVDNDHPDKFTTAVNFSLNFPMLRFIFCLYLQRHYPK